MQYMMLIYQAEPGGIDPSADHPDCDGLVDRTRARGEYVASGILHPTHAATSLRVRGGKRLVTDGPFAETREALAGYLLVEAPDLDAALRIAAEHPVARTGTVEVRPVMFSYDWPQLQGAAVGVGS